MKIQKHLTTAVVVTGLVIGAATSASAHGSGGSQGWGMMGPGSGSGYGWCPDDMMGHGMMGQGMGPGMMMGHGMMGQGMMGQGMGPGMMGQGQMQPLREDLSVADVRHMMEHRLTWQGNPDHKLGKIEEKDSDTIIAEVVTKDGSPIRKFEVNRHTGSMRPVQ